MIFRRGFYIKIFVGEPFEDNGCFFSKFSGIVRPGGNKNYKVFN